MSLTIPLDHWGEPVRIACNNWAEDYGYAPIVSMAAKHNGRELTLKFIVDENFTQALVEHDNGEVWTDSCVEFFISFDDTGYYNFEFSCIGKALLAFRKTKPEATHASADILALIKRSSTLGDKCFKEKTGQLHWELTVGIPLRAFFKHDIKNFRGVEARANFYKCGDGLTRPHFLSWAPIATPSPNFHVPQFFDTVAFEK